MSFIKQTVLNAVCTDCKYLIVQTWREVLYKYLNCIREFQVNRHEESNAESCFLAGAI